MIRKLPGIVFSALLVGLAPGAYAQSGYIQMTSSGDANAVTINLTITDPGGGPPGCDWLGVTRGYGGPIVGVVARQPGTTFSTQVVDTGLQPSTIYCYRMVLLMLPIPVNLYCGGDVSSLCQVFQCFYDIQTCINTGPGPAFMGHGFLSTLNADGNEVKAFLYPCSGDANGPFLGFADVSGTAAQYVDSGIAVDVYGEPLCCWAQGAWQYTATAALPQPCVVATDQKTWGAVKAMYRN